jgi:hypothetical protein
MASINGYQLKSVKSYRGHDGDTLIQGSLYKDGKKVGFYSDGDWGGENTYEFNGSVSMKEQCKIEREFDRLVNDWLVLWETEKYYKQCLKKGYDAVVLINEGWKSKMMAYRKSSEHQREEVLATLREEMKKDDVKISFFKKLADFDTNNKIRGGVFND